MKQFSFPFICFSGLAIAACGSGGGGGNGGSGSPDPIDQQAFAQIEPGNYEAATALSLSFGEALSSGASTFFGTDAGPSFKLSHNDSASGVLSPEEVVDCDAGGEFGLRIDKDNVSSETLDAGDRILTRFLNCQLTSDTLINGEFDITFLTSGTIGTNDFSITTDYDNFRVTDVQEGTVSTLNGSVDSTGTSQGNTTTFSSQTNNLRIDVSTPGSQDTISLPGFTTTTRSNSVLRVTTDEVDGFMQSATLLGGSLSIETVVGLQTQWPNEYPSSGMLVITGKDNSSIMVTALSSTNVQLDMDYDGDNTIDETVVTRWDDVL